MLHKETVAPGTLELLTRLMSDDTLSQFVLVGGTSLSLQIGHRISVDLDLFSDTSFNEIELSEYLISEYRLQLDFISKRTVKGEIEGIQIDCIAHRYPWIAPFNQEGAIRLAGFSDVAAMKLNAISGNGTRIKDFIDVAYLSCRMSLKDMLQAYEQKYETNSIIPLKSITFFDDVNFNEPIKMIASERFNWKKIEKRLLEMQKYPEKVFNTFPA